MDCGELHTIGNNIFKAFNALHRFSDFHDIEPEEQRFRLWAHSLGLHRTGHASLDYRIRDATIVRVRICDILEELQNHLENLCAIWAGDRPSLENSDDIPSDEDSDSTTPSETASISSDDSNDLTPSSEASFHEVEFRLSSISDSVNALYSISTKIRNPLNRPQRSTVELYKHISVDVRDQYMRECEKISTALVSYVQRQQLLQGVPSELPVNEIQALIDAFTSSDHWLIRRTGIANARRKQQFLYWKIHAQRISRQPLEEKSKSSQEIQPQIAVPDATSSIPTPNNDGMQPIETQPHSLATSATKLDAAFVMPDDTKSTFSQESRPSTVMNLKGERLEWPSPPIEDTANGFFLCPYCKVICPSSYLSEPSWR